MGNIPRGADVLTNASLMRYFISLAKREVSWRLPPPSHIQQRVELGIKEQFGDS